MKKTRGDRTLIPKEKLAEGFVRCSLHIQSLIESSQILFDKENYSASTAMSILAFEETTKLHLINNYIKQGKGISENDWNKITILPGVHSHKLTGAITDYKKTLSEMGSEKFYSHEVISSVEFNDPTPHRDYYQLIASLSGIEEILSKLNKVKQDCFYLNWKNCEWLTYNNFSDIQRKAFAFVNLNLAKFIYFIELENRYGNFIIGIIDPDHNKTTADATENDWALLKNNPYKKIVYEIIINMQTPLFRESSATARYMLAEFYKFPNKS